MRWQERRPDPPTDVVQPRTRAAAASPIDLVLGLQRGAGNHAVARLVSPARPALARFAVQVRTDATDDDRWVSDIRVAGRPKHRLISGAEGSHVTAWAVFADLVRRQLVGKDPQDALTDAKTMLKDQAASLTADWPGIAPEPVQAALKDAGTVSADLPVDAGAAREQSHLQEVIGAYLTLHNLRPGTVVLLGKGKALGAGEARNLSTLRKHEVDGAQPVKALNAAFFAMLDDLALGHIDMLAAPSPTAPGVNAGDPNRVGRAVLNGLKDLAAAYPRSYASVMTDANAVSDWLTEMKLPNTLPEPAPATPDSWPAPEGWSRTDEDAAQEVNDRSAICQIVLGAPQPRKDGKAPGPAVVDVRMSGRPPTLTKGEQGHHTVAWSLETLRLATLLKGKPLDAATATLRSVCEETLAELDEGLGWLSDEEAMDEPTEDSKYTRILLEGAKADLTLRAVSIDPDTDGTLAVVEGMQRLVEAWMRAMNVMPLASADKGAVPGSHGESTAIPVLKAYEQLADGKRPRSMGTK